MGIPRFGYLVRINGRSWAFADRRDVTKEPSRVKAFELDPALIEETPTSEAGLFAYRGPVPADW